MKNVQIPYELFLALLQYHLMMEDDYEDEIRHGLEQKLESMVRHQLYAKYKTALTPEEREAACQRYLDERGIPKSYRWTTSPYELWTGAWHAPVNSRQGKALVDTAAPAHLSSLPKIRRFEADSLREMIAVSLRQWAVNVPQDRQRPCRVLQNLYRL